MSKLIATGLEKTVPHCWFLKKLERKQTFSLFFLRVIFMIFEFSVILDQSKVCSSNDLRVGVNYHGLRVGVHYQFDKMLFFYLNHWTEYCNVFTYSYAISKQIKLEYPAMSH